MTFEEIVAAHPPLPQSLALIWTAVVDIGERVDLGPSTDGHRYIIPITGGRVFAGEAGPGMDGTILPGGADRQLVKADGFTRLDALYEMQVGDGAILTIRNRVKVDPLENGERYARSVIEVTAPKGPFDWLNRRVIVGTLQPARPAREAVIIRGWCVL